MATNTTPKYDVFNVATGEALKVTVTAEELAQREADAAEHKSQIAAVVTARQSAIEKLAELGLTEEEIAAL